MSVHPLADILEWYLHGIWQQVLLWVPLLRPASEPSIPPRFWREYWSYVWWNHDLDPARRPNRSWLRRWMTAVKEAFRVKVESVGDLARDAATRHVRGWLGWAQYGYTTFQAWIGVVESRVGAWVPGWASDLADAARRLYNWLPSEIRNSWQTWDGIWDEIKGLVWRWVTDRYEHARTLAYWAQDWIIWLANVLVAWYNNAHAFLDDFRHNARARVLSWLGAEYRRLLAFGANCLDFYFSLWSVHAQTLAAFLADPLGWLYNRAEDELVRRW